MNVVAKNGVGKAVTAAGLALATEYTFYKAKIGQVYEYKMDQYLNGGKHSSGKSFLFQLNEKSIFDRLVEKR